MSQQARGLVYHCNVCGAEITVLALEMGAFTPHCCNQPMVPQPRHVDFYRCPVCGAEIAVLRRGTGVFAPHCCNTDMRLNAA